MERNGSNVLNVGELVKYKENMAIITNVNDESIEIKYNNKSFQVEKDSLKYIEHLKFYVEKMDVLNGGGFRVKDNIVPFEWIDPPFPYHDAHTCTHGIGELAELGVTTTISSIMYEKLMMYFQQHYDRLKSNPMSTPEHITETVIDFLKKEPD